MRRWWLAVFPALCQLVTAAPQEPIAARELMVAVTADATEVEFGKAFPITVVRVWDKALVPEGWTDAALAPLVLKPVGVSRREGAAHIEETRRFLGYAFSREEIVVPAVALRASPRDAGPERFASSDAFRLRVVAAVDAEDPGGAELPSGPFDAPVPWLRWTGLGVLVLASLSLLTWFTRRRLRRPAPPPRRLPPHEQALERLQRLRAQPPQGPEETRTYYVELADLTREYLEGRAFVTIDGMTTEELETRIAGNVPDHQVIGELFAQCDLAKFARHTPPDGERERWLTTVETYVRETA